MAEIKVLSPVTSNGINPILDEKGQIVYKETILDAKAKPILEKINAGLPPHLKKLITAVEVEKPKKDGKAN